MARPRKEGMDYFPHDCNLSTDKKVEALRILHGNDGYVFFCIMLENIYQEPNFELDVSDAETIQILAKKVEVTPLKLEEMIKTAIKHGCFDRERYEKDQVLTSNGIKKRADVVVNKRVNMRVYHEKKVSGEVSAAETGEESTQSKVKESKSKVIDIKDTTTTVNPFKLFESEGFGMLTAILGEKIGDFIDTYSERWVCEAMKEAAYYQKRNLPYVKSILDRYKTSGIDEPWNKPKEGVKHGETTEGVRQGSHAGNVKPSESKSGVLPSKWVKFDKDGNLLPVSGMQG